VRIYLRSLKVLPELHPASSKLQGKKAEKRLTKFDPVQ